MLALIIDNDRRWLASADRYFSIFRTRVVIAECQSVNDAINAIDAHQPCVVFLDHQLTTGGSEGFEIANCLVSKGIKTFTTTSNTQAQAIYQSRGIEHVAKTDLSKMRVIIENLT